MSAEGVGGLCPGSSWWPEERVLVVDGGAGREARETHKDTGVHQGLEVESDAESKGIRCQRGGSRQLPAKGPHGRPSAEAGAAETPEHRAHRHGRNTGLVNPTESAHQAVNAIFAEP